MHSYLQISTAIANLVSSAILDRDYYRRLLPLLLLALWLQSETQIVWLSQKVKCWRNSYFDVILVASVALGLVGWSRLRFMAGALLVPLMMEKSAARVHLLSLPVLEVCGFDVESV